MAQLPSPGHKGTKNKTGVSKKQKTKKLEFPRPSVFPCFLYCFPLLGSLFHSLYLPLHPVNLPWSGLSISCFPTFHLSQSQAFFLLPGPVSQRYLWGWELWLLQCQPYPCSVLLPWALSDPSFPTITDSPLLSCLSGLGCLFLLGSRRGGDEQCGEQMWDSLPPYPPPARCGSSGG